MYLRRQIKFFTKRENVSHRHATSQSNERATAFGSFAFGLDDRLKTIFARDHAELRELVDGARRVGTGSPDSEAMLHVYSFSTNSLRPN